MILRPKAMKDVQPEPESQTDLEINDDTEEIEDEKDDDYVEDEL